jgi:hypothetical protein
MAGDSLFVPSGADLSPALAGGIAVSIRITTYWVLLALAIGSTGKIPESTWNKPDS